MKHEVEQGLHEKLCAYVLGEASDEVRAEVEAALEASEELRAEKERLEQTIGLVQETLGTADAVPAISAEEILADARAARRRPWYGRPAYRAAAGIAAVSLLGVLGYQSMRSRDVGEGRSQHSARSTEDKELAASKKLREAGSNERDSRAGGLGYAGTNPPAVAKAEAPAATAPTEMREESLAMQAAPSPSASSASAASPSAPSPSAPSPSAPSPSAKEPMIDSTLLGHLDEQAGSGAPIAKSELDAKRKTTLSQGEMKQLRGLGYVSGDDRSGASNQATDRLAAVAPSAKRSSSRYVGPGDTMPAGQSREDSPAFGGSRYGAPPDAPGAAGPTTLSDDALRAGANSSGAKDLRALGYAGEKNDFKVSLGEDQDDFGLDSADLGTIDRLRQLDPADRDRWIENECQRILRGCRRLPNEKPTAMFFRFYGDNPFEITALDAQSTFSVDVDTASYALARRYLNEGHIPEKAQVRTEEFVNYFKPDVPHPTQGTFAIHTDLTPSRFSGDKPRSMLRVVVSGREVSKVERKPLNLTFVVDVSGSMREQNRLGMVKHAIRLLVDELGGGDNLAIVAFSNDARVVLPMTSVRNRSAVESALYPLQPENSTNSEAGLKLGYEIALANINPEAQNRVVFLSDGVANVGETDPAKLSESVKPIREKGVYLNTIGVGMNNHNDVLLEQLADKGDGVCNYIDSPDEARRVIVDGFTGTFETIARDVKIQVEFDPAQVERYRLLGYENRAIANKDFRNDKIDAGEVGAGHQVTALYELELAPGAPLASAAQGKLGGLGYLDGPRPSSAPPTKPLATVRLRWKAPRSVSAPTANEEATEIAEPVFLKSQTSFEGAGLGYRRAVVVAQFAEFLRRSVHARGESLDDLIAEADKLEKETHDAETGELVVLLHKSKSLILAALPKCDDLCDAIESLRRRELLRCELSQLERGQDKSRIEDLEKQNQELEQRVRDLLRKRIESR